MVAAYPMGGLALSFNPQHNGIVRPTGKTCFVSKLAEGKYFDRLKMWGDDWHEI